MVSRRPWSRFLRANWGLVVAAALSIAFPGVAAYTMSGGWPRGVQALSGTMETITVLAALAWLVAVAQGAIYSTQRLLTLPARLRTHAREQLRRARADGKSDDEMDALERQLAAEQRARYRRERAGWLAVASGQLVITVLLFAFWYYIIGVRDTSGACVNGAPSWSGQGACDGHFIWSSLYLSIVTITTLGYGDVQPYGIARALAGAEALIGLLYSGVFIAGLTHVLERTDFEQEMLHAGERQER